MVADRALLLRPEYAMSPPDTEQDAGQSSESRIESETAPAGSETWKPVFPEPLGIGLIVTLVVGLVGVSVFAHLALQRQEQQAHISEGQALGNAIARSLGHIAKHDPTDAESVFQRLCAGSTSLLAAVWTDSDGRERGRWPATTSAGQSSVVPTASAGGANSLPGASTGAYASTSGRWTPFSRACTATRAGSRRSLSR
jgi:hypothetical protein